MQAAEDTHRDGHPRPALYVGVALVLGVITLIEVAVFYAEGAKRFIIPILLALSAAKFVLVAGFYMHLKFDSPLFRRLFAGGIVMAAAIYAAVLAMFGPVR
jgi:cytochrome c oxidase subunit 4